MKKILIISGVVLAVVGAYVLLVSIAESPSSKTSVVIEEDGVSKEKSFDFSKSGKYIGSFLELMNSGKDLECVNSYTVEGVVTNGIAYISGDNVYAVYTSNVPMIGKMKSFIITDKDNVYTWSTMTDTGYVTPRDYQPSSAEEASSNKAVDLSKDFEYNCKPWVVDKKVFVLPSEIIFENISTNL